MQSKQWKHPGSAPGSLPPKKFKRVHSAGKIMAALFWDSKGVIMVYYLEQGSTINGTILCGQIETDTPGNRKKDARTTELLCSALAHVTSCHDCCD